MRIRWQLISVFVAAVLAFAIAGCGGGGGTNDPLPDPPDGNDPPSTNAWTGTAATSSIPDPQIVGVPEVPFDALETSRTPSTEGTQLELMGTEYLQQYHGTADGTSLVLEALDPGTGGAELELAFGLYRFSGLTGKDLEWLNIECLPRMFGEEYFVAIADYTLGDWRWFGPVTFPEFQLDLTDLNHHIVTELGNMYFIVVCEPGNGATISRSVLTVAEGGGGGDGLLPGAPRQLKATDGDYDDMIVIEWNAGADADSYELWRNSENAGQGWELYAETAGTRFEDDDVMPGEKYWYKAFSVNEHGRSHHSNIDAGYAGERGDDPEPGEPYDLEASDGEFEDMVFIWWECEGDWDYFKLWRKTDGGDWGVYDETDDLEYEDWDVEPGVKYWYKVQAVIDGTDGQKSNIDDGYAGEYSGEGIPAPEDLEASDGEFAAHILLEWEWDYDEDGVFEIWRSSEGEEWHSYAETESYEYEDTDVAPGKVYSYKVWAWVGNNRSDHSNIDEGYAGEDTGDIPAPWDLEASDGEYPDAIIVSWEWDFDYAEDVAFELFRKSGEDGEWSSYAETTDNVFEDSDVVPGQTYGYKVKAWVGDGHSGYSNTDHGYAGEGGEGVPAPWDLEASDGEYGDKVVVEWEYEIAGAGFDIWRKTGEDGEWAYYDETLELHFEDDGVEPDVTYWYKVYAWVDGERSEGHSNIDSGYAGEGGEGIPAPYDLWASQGAHTDHVVLEWMHDYEGDVLFVIKRKPLIDGGEWGIIDDGVDGERFEDFGVEPGQHYEYAVKAVAGDDVSGWSNHAEGWAEGETHPAPYGLTASKGDYADHILIEWLYDTDDNDGFEVWRKQDGEGHEWDMIDTTAAMEYEDYELPGDFTFVYKVRAIYGDENFSDFSNTDFGYLADPTTGSIEVLVEHEGSPVGGIEVWLFGNEVPEMALTGESGVALFDGLEFGDYLIVPWDGMYEFTAMRSLLTVALEDRELSHTFDATVSATLPHRLWGVCYEFDGTLGVERYSGLAGVDVAVDATEGSGHDVVTDELGFWFVDGLNVGTWTSTPFADGYTFDPEERIASIDGDSIVDPHPFRGFPAE